MMSSNIFGAFFYEFSLVYRRDVWCECVMLKLQNDRSSLFPLAVLSLIVFCSSRPGARLSS